MSCILHESQWLQACEAWPNVDLSKELFQAFLFEHNFTVTGQNAADVGELFLVCACLKRLSAAVLAFQSHYLVPARPALTQLNLGATVAISDIEQRTWEKLFVPRDGDRPKILDYVGRGNLATLIKVISVRFALSQLRMNKRAVMCSTSQLLDLPDKFDDPTLELIRADFKKQFAPAFAAALAQLSKRDRNFLRLRFVEGLSVEQLSRLYQIHRVTASRRLTRIRRDLREETRGKLRAKLQLSTESLDSLMKLVDSQLDMSIDLAFSSVEEVCSHSEAHHHPSISAEVAICADKNFKKNATRKKFV